MKKNLVLEIVLGMIAVLTTVIVTSCSAKQKGYSVSMPSKQVDVQDSDAVVVQESDVLTQDDEFLAMIEKIESGEITPEPPRNQEVVEQPQIEIPEGELLEIKEKMFLTQINDIYFNFERYKEKTIVVEGMFTYLVSYLDDSEFPAVYRRGPGCCGNDGWGGFMLDWKGTYPEKEAWIKVVGKPIIKDYKGYQDLYLKVLSLEVKNERGLEFVMN